MLVSFKPKLLLTMYQLTRLGLGVCWEFLEAKRDVLLLAYPRPGFLSCIVRMENLRE